MLLLVSISWFHISFFMGGKLQLGRSNLCFFWRWEHFLTWWAQKLKNIRLHLFASTSISRSSTSDTFTLSSKWTTRFPPKKQTNIYNGLKLKFHFFWRAGKVFFINRFNLISVQCTMSSIWGCVWRWTLSWRENKNYVWEVTDNALLRSSA